MSCAQRIGTILLLALVLTSLPVTETDAQMVRRQPPADSLRRVLHAVGSDSSRMPVLLLRLGMALQFENKDDSAAACFRSLLRMERHANDSIRVIALRQLGAISIRADRIAEGRALFERGMRIAEKSGDQDLRHSLMQHVAATYQSDGAHSKALELLLECLRYQESRKRTRESAMLHLTIGDLYFKIEAYEQAIREHRSAIAIFEPMGKSYLLGRAYFMLATVYEQTNRRDSAEICFAQTLRISKEVGDPEGAARSCEQLGHICLSQGRLGDAEAYFNQALEFTKQEFAPIAAAGAHRGLALVHIGAREYGQAAEHLSSALDIAQTPGTQDLRVLVLRDLATVREHLSDYPGALEHMRLYTLERDSLLARQNRTQMNELLARYEAEQREQQILLLEKDNRLKDVELQRNQLQARQQATALTLLSRENDIKSLKLDLTNAELREKSARLRETQQDLVVSAKDRLLQAAVVERKTLQRNAIAGGFVLLAVLSFLLLRNFLLRRRTSEARAAEAELRAEAAQGESLRLRTEIAEREREAQLRFTRELLRAQEDERQRIASDLHDSLAQKLVVIQNRATLAQRHSADYPELLQQFTRIADTAVDTIAEVRAISHALRPQLLHRFGLSAALRNLVEEVGEASDVRWTAEIDELKGALAADDEINLYRIVQEGMNNTMRHARASAGTVEVRRNGRTLLVTLSDDGVGYDPRVASEDGSAGPHGMGLQSMRRRAELLGAAFRVESRPGAGTRITLELPTETPAALKD